MKSQLKRLVPASETIKKLLLRSGNECAFPGCSEILFNDGDKLIAECCHIEAALPGGERYNFSQTDEERRSYNNLLFLCHRHHIETNDVDRYTVEVLKRIKNDHESRFKEKPFAIKDTYVEQVNLAINHLITLVEDTAIRVKNIDQKQDLLLELLEQNSINKESAVFQEYFGVPQTLGFEGRVDELKELAIAFDSYNTLVIEGVSGIGKTSLTANFLIDKKDYKILWIDCETIKNRQTLFEYAARFISQEFNDSSIQKSLASLDNHKIDRALLQCFRQYKSCIVFDAINTDLHELIPTMKYWNQYLKESKILISTNQKINLIWHNPIYKLQLKGLDEDSFFSLLSKFDVVKNDISIRLFRLISGHPYLLKLCISVIEYLPISELIIEIEKHDKSEINDYIKVKAFETLSNNDLVLLNSLALLTIPFRFSIGEFLQIENFRKSFKELRKKFLVENYYSEFFIIPEFISVQIVKGNNDDLEKLSSNYVAYLRSINSDARIFEKESLIYHAIRANMIDLAKVESQKFLSALMTHGQFNLAFKVATELEDEGSFANWSYIQYIKGRVFRFQEAYQEALQCYNIGLKLGLDQLELNTFKFEKASLLIYLSRYENNTSLKDEAINIYEHLGKSENATLALQCHLSIAYTFLSDEKFAEVIDKLKKLISDKKFINAEPNALAALWQLLGDAYSKSKNYEDAFTAFDNSIDYYKVAIEKFGMNVIDGLYHLYSSYGWTYANAGNYNSACRLFELALGLSTTFNLGLKNETALFDYGFHLIMDEQFQKAEQVLKDHYSFIIENQLLDKSDMPFIHGCLAFVHWYCNQFLDAVELMGLYILSCYNRDITPVISVIEEDNMIEKINVLKYFKNRMYIFILPSKKNHTHFNKWIKIVVKKHPELEQPLNQFHYLKRDADF